MAQVRCPKCGKFNPVEAEVCKYCGAPIKPEPSGTVQPVQAGDAVQPQNTADLEPGLPDWLRELRGDQNAPSQEAPSSGGGEGGKDANKVEETGDEVPDWLARIREHARANPSQDSVSDEDSLQGLTADQNQSQANSNDEEDWFDRLRSFSPGEEAESPTVSKKTPDSKQVTVPEPQEDSGVPGWLAALGSDRQPDKPAESGNIPDHLTGQRQPPSFPAPETPTAVSSENEPAAAPFDMSLPDYLASMDKSELGENAKLNAVQPVSPTAGHEEPPAASVPEQPAAGQKESLHDETPLPVSVQPVESPQPQPESPFEEAWPHWLAGLEGAPAGETAVPQVLPVGTPPAQPQPEPPLEEALPSWLASLEESPAREGAAPQVPPVGTPPVQPQAEPPLEEALPDWLASLEESPAREGAAPQLPPAKTPSAQPQAEPPSEEALPGWLASLEESPAGEGAAPQVPPAETPSAQPQPEPPLEEALPGWLASLEESPAGEAAAPQVPPVETLPAQPEAVVPINEVIPDWLAGLGEPAAEGNVAPPVAAQPVDQVGGPAVESQPPAQPAENAPVQPEMTSESLEPDWLFGHPGAQLTGAESIESTEGLPEWMTGLPSTEQPEAAAAGELPDWLDGVKPPETPIPSEPTQDNLPPAVDGTMPDWLVGLQAQQQPASWESVPPVAAEESTAEGLGHASPFVSDSLPDWLSQIEPSVEETPLEPAVAPLKQEEKDAEGLEPAELPNWLQAMRPIEMATPSAPIPVEVDERVEKSGPLAGLQGILPTSGVPVDARKTGFYSIKLHLTDKQRINASSFDSLIAAEAQPQPIEKESPRLKISIMNIIVALLLIVAVWLPIWIGGQVMSLPGFTLPETSAMQDAINGLPSNATVLVAIDYEPANVGEMESVSVGVISHLMSKSSNLVLISTNPSGQVLGEKLLTQARNYGHLADYQINEKTVNLGYLAGGTAALYNFAAYPKMAAPVTTDQQNAWELPILQNLNQGDNPLANLAQIIVITPDIDTARGWIEQVGPVLPGVPLFVLTSAQTSPLLSPYIDSGQVKGSVAGITGGAIYEQALGKPSISHNYWDAYQAGILVLIFLILLGGLVNIAGVLLSRRKLRQGE